MIRRRDPTRPFFLWISHHAPHSPYDPPQALWDMYADREQPPVPVGDWAKRYDVAGPGLPVTAWYGRLTPEQTRRARIGYMARSPTWTSSSATCWRNCVETASPRIRSSSIHPTTATCWATITFTARPTPMRARRGCPSSSAIPRSYEGPKGICDRVVGLQDVMPTILEVAGVEPPSGMTGRSVLAAARGALAEFLR